MNYKVTIKIGENPQGIPFVNKFLGKSGDGYRGVIIALHKDGTQAIIIAINGSAEVVWGQMYLVKETQPENYPVVVKKVNSVPKSDDWKIAINPLEVA